MKRMLDPCLLILAAIYLSACAHAQQHDSEWLLEKKKYQEACEKFDAENLVRINSRGPGEERMHTADLIALHCRNRGPGCGAPSKQSIGQLGYYETMWGEPITPDYCIK